MIVSEYIKQKFQTFDIDISDSEILDICINSDINCEDEISSDIRPKVFFGIAKFIPYLLLRAKSISEGDVSKSWDIQGIKDFYSWICNELGIKNELTYKPKLKFL